MWKELPEELTCDALEVEIEKRVWQGEIDDGKLMENPATRCLGNGWRRNGCFGEEEESENFGGNGVRSRSEGEDGGAEEKGRGRVDEDVEKVVRNKGNEGVRVGVGEKEKERFENGLE